MLRLVYILIFFALSAHTYGQSIDPRREQELNTAEALGATKAVSFVKLSYDKNNVTTLEKQVAVWKKAVEAENNNKEYWFNYYMVTRLYFLQSNGGNINTEGKTKLAFIAMQIDLNIKGETALSFEKSLVKYFEAASWDIALPHLQNAYKFCEPFKLDAPRLYPEINNFLLPEMARYYEYKGDAKQRNSICSKINNSAHGTAIYEFAKAQINTVPDSSILITNGEYDTYSLWLAASYSGKKITALSLKLLENKEYCKEVLAKNGLLSTTFDASDKKAFLEQLVKNNPGKKIYISLTVNNAYVSGLTKNLYNTGVCYLYSTYALDNISILYKNLVEKEVFSSIPRTENAVLKNCMPGYVTLYRHYKDSDRQKAEKAADKAASIAQQAGFWTEYKKYFDRQ